MMAGGKNLSKPQDPRQAGISDGPAGGSTIDALHDGAFEVVQPARGGHRAGLDALLLAAMVPADASGLLADLGAGTGAAGLAALNLNRDLDLLSVERNAATFELLQKTMRLNANTRFRARVRTLRSDVTKSGAERLREGLNEKSADHVIMNPPYNPSGYRVPPDVSKAEAHMMGEGGIDAWFRTASAMLRPGGTLSLVHRTENLAEILACSQGRFGTLTLKPVHSKPGQAAKRILVQGMRGSRGAMSLLPGLVVHEENGEFTDLADAIFKGQARLEMTAGSK